MKEGFSPIKLVDAPAKGDGNPTKITATVNLKGVAAQEFDEMATEHGLNRAQLLTQMVYHCLGRTKDLKDFYRRLAILGE